MTSEQPIAGERCANCQALLSGAFCSACGQRHEPHIHSVREFAAEAFESVTHADSRVWRTLWPLITKPGFLTRELIEGRRARYLPPFRLYLVLSIIFFLVAAVASRSTAVVELGVREGGSVTNPQDLTVEGRRPGETAQQRATRICYQEGHYGGPWPKSFVPRLKAGCYKLVIDDGRAFSHALINNIPRALFLLLPLLALVMSALYWRRYYVEHLLFFLHTHAFTFLLLTVFWIALAVTNNPWLIAALIIAVLFLVPLYTYKAMRRVYEQGRWITRGKFLVLSLAYLLFVVLLAGITSLYSLVTL